MESCRSIKELQQYIDNLDTSQFEKLVKPILQVNRNAAVDRVAQCSLPRDAPTGLVPVVTSGDGNCFPRSISRAIFGSERRHKEIRACIVIEGIKNKDTYLDNNSSAICNVFRSIYTSCRKFG